MTVKAAAVLAAWGRQLETEGYHSARPCVLIVTQGSNPLPVLLLDSELDDDDAERLLLAALGVLRKA